MEASGRSFCKRCWNGSRRRGRGLSENKYSTDLESTNGTSANARVCMSIHPERTGIKSCSDLGRVPVLDDPLAGPGDRLRRAYLDLDFKDGSHSAATTGDGDGDGGGDGSYAVAADDVVLHFVPATVGRGIILVHFSA